MPGSDRSSTTSDGGSRSMTAKASTPSPDRFDVEPVGFQRPGDPGANAFVVVDHQHSARLLHNATVLVEQELR